MSEPTITQNSALYFAQHKKSKQRAALFRRFGAVARKQRPADDLFLWPRLQRDAER